MCGIWWKPFDSTEKMAIYLLEHTANYRLGVWKMEEDETQLEELAGVSAPASRVNSVRRLEFLAVRSLAAMMGIHASDIAYLPSGKPLLKAGDESISISHTKNYVGLLLSRHEHIGLDLEQRSERVRKIRHKFMHPDEEAQLKSISNPANETVGLLLHWCAKESLFKSVSEEGIDFAQELRISLLDSLDEAGRFKGRFLRTGEMFEIDYAIKPDFVLTCSFSTGSK